jgi:hypothetical protein
MLSMGMALGSLPSTLVPSKKVKKKNHLGFEVQNLNTDFHNVIVTEVLVPKFRETNVEGKKYIL